MQKKKSARRDFIKLSAMGLGGFAVTPFDGIKETSTLNTAVTSGKNLHIVCVGAHPGDPEFGCGGTMAKYSDAGHTVTFIYLTRGEASDPNKSYSEMAALRTKEAESACKVLKAKLKFAGQIDGNTVLDKEKNEEMTRLIMAEKPDIVFTVACRFAFRSPGYGFVGVNGLDKIRAAIRSLFLRSKYRNRNYGIYTN